MNHPRVYSRAQLERVISERFSVSLMSDSKWERLIERLTDTFADGLHLNYKLLHTESVYRTTFFASDLKPFFVEPTVYREVEWIEVSHRYEGYVNRKNRKARRRIHDQDVSAIGREIQLTALGAGRAQTRRHTPRQSRNLLAILHGSPTCLSGAAAHFQR